MFWEDGIKGEKAREIITTDKNPLCVIAGPGTGKTFALMRRTAKFLEEHSANPSKILVITFTRVTAQDMIKSLSELNVEGTENIKATTLHSFCFSTLMRRGVLEITGRNPRTLLDFEKRFLLEDLKPLGLTIPALEKKLKAFEADWARLQHDQPGWAPDESDQNFSRELNNWLICHDAMLIEEIVPLTLNYLRNNPACIEREMFDYIFVDEYQDLNKAEQTLIELLASNSTMMVIGDEDQSIYESFRFAHPEGILEYGQKYPENLIIMDECRRCPKNIVQIANKLISHNQLRNEKKLEVLNENDDGKINVIQWNNMDDEINGISKFIKNEIINGRDPGKILILCPSRKIGYKIRDKLNNSNIEAKSFFHEELLDGNVTNYETSNAEKAFTMLNLLANPNDKIGFRNYLGFGSSTLRSKSYAKILKYGNENNISPKEVLKKITNGEITIPYTNSLIEQFIKFTEEYNSLVDLNTPELLKVLFPNEEWAKDFQPFLAKINTDHSLEEIYNELKTNVIQPDIPTDVNYVRIMSLHKSKGLTADLVVVCGCVDGLIPHRNDKKGVSREELNREMEEQRRLFYVGITRTTNILILSSFLKLPAPLSYKMRIKRRSIKRRIAETIASPFIPELGPTLPQPITGYEFLNINSMTDNSN